MFFCDLDCFMALILSAFLHIACVFWKCLPSLNCLNIMMFALHQESNLVKNMSQVKCVRQFELGETIKVGSVSTFREEIINPQLAELIE